MQAVSSGPAYDVSIDVILSIPARRTQEQVSRECLLEVERIDDMDLFHAGIAVNCGSADGRLSPSPSNAGQPYDFFLVSADRIAAGRLFPVKACEFEGVMENDGHVGRAHVVQAS